MITFKSLTDLNQLPAEHPARPVVVAAFYQLIDACTWKGRAYRPENDGYVVLIEEEDIERVIDLPELHCPLADVPWEAKPAKVEAEVITEKAPEKPLKNEAKSKPAKVADKPTKVPEKPAAPSKKATAKATPKKGSPR